MGNTTVRMLAGINLLCALYLFSTGQDWQFSAFSASFFAIAGNWRAQ